MDWDRTLEGYVLARNGSTEVRPLEAIVEERMIAFATSLVLVACRISFKKGRSPLGRTFFYLVKYSWEGYEEYVSMKYDFPITPNTRMIKILTGLLMQGVEGHTHGQLVWK